MKEGIGWGLFLVAVAVIVYMYFNPTKDKKTISNTDTLVDNTEVKCEVMDSYGRTITITGDSSDPQFQQMCQSQPRQPLYIYGYPYTFVRFHDGGGHHGGGDHH